MGVGSQNTILTYDPYPIARLCCEFQLSKGKTVGGDAFQRPKSTSKIYLSMDKHELYDFLPISSFFRFCIIKLRVILRFKTS